MSTESDRLVVLNLKYNYREFSLNKILYADFSLKAIYQNQSEEKGEVLRPLSTKRIRKAIASMLGVAQVSKTTVKESLSILKRQKKVIEQSAGWTLTKPALEDITHKLKQDEVMIEGVLTRHFPNDVDKLILEQWFYDTSTTIFSQFGESIVANLTANKSAYFGRINLDKVINSTAKTHKLQHKKAALVGGYQSFITSTDANDYPLLMQLSVSGFAARLVAANLGTDPLTLEQLKGATLLLDTNLLFNIKLRRRIFEKSMSTLGKALSEIDAKVVYLPSTRDEYIRVINYAETETIKTVEAYGVGKLKRLDVDDDFIKAGLAARCKDADDFKKFFSDLRDLPEKLDNGPSIKQLADEVTEDIVEKAAADTKLKNIIQGTRKDFKKKEANDNSLNHDAALIRVSEFLVNESPKGWTITMDSVLKYVAIAVAGKGLPGVMGLDTLIELLALNDVGPSFNSIDFAPLLASILKNHCLPSGGSQQIKVSDLVKLNAVVQDAQNLPDDQLKTLANFVVKTRIQNKKFESTEVQEQLATIQGKVFEDYDEKLQKAQEKGDKESRMRQSAEIVSAQLTEKLNTVRSLAINDRARILRAQALKVFIKDLIIRLVIVCIIIVFLGLFSDGIIKDSSVLNYLTYITGALSWIVWLYRPFKVFQKARQDSFQKAEKEIDS